jgi:hypothetical protein
LFCNVASNFEIEERHEKTKKAMPPFHAKNIPSKFFYAALSIVNILAESLTDDPFMWNQVKKLHRSMNMTGVS